LFGEKKGKGDLNPAGGEEVVGSRIPVLKDAGDLKGIDS
jgi:hypothetical protein